MQLMLQDEIEKVSNGRSQVQIIMELIIAREDQIREFRQLNCEQLTKDSELRRRIA